MFRMFVNLNEVIDPADADFYMQQRKVNGINPTKRFSSESIPLATELGVAKTLANAIEKNKGHFRRQKSNGETIISPLKIIADTEVAGDYYLGQGGNIVNAGKLAINAKGPRGEKARSIASDNLDETLAALKYATVNVSGKQVHHMNEIDSTARYAGQLLPENRGPHLNTVPHFGFFMADDRRNQTALRGNVITGPKDPRGDRYIPSMMTDEHQAGVHRLYDTIAAQKGMPNTNKKTSIEEAMAKLPSNTQKEALIWSHLYLSRLALQEQKGIDSKDTELLLDQELLNTRNMDPYESLNARFEGAKNLRDQLPAIETSADDVGIRQERASREAANTFRQTPKEIARRRMINRR